MEGLFTAIGDIGSSAIDLITANKAAKFGRLPDWLSAKDFDNRDRTPQIILFGVLAIIIVIVIAIVLVNRKK